MAKVAKAQPQSDLFPETQAIIALLSKDSDQDLVILAVPSHDRKNKAIAESLVGEWTSNAMQLMADLYGGATAFDALKGIYKSDEGHYLWDDPRTIEAYATVQAIQDPIKLNSLVGFCKRMGKTMNQESVMLIFGTVMYYLKDYSGV